MKIVLSRLVSILSFCFLLLPVYLRGQHSSFYRFHFTDENGFLQNTSYAIGKNKLGYAWILSEYGLARVDGMHITNYLNTTYFNSPGRKFSSILWSNDGSIYACEDTSTRDPFKLDIHPEKQNGAATLFFNSAYHQLLFSKDLPANYQKAATDLLKSNKLFYYTPQQELYVIDGKKVHYFNTNQSLLNTLFSAPSCVVPVGDHLVILSGQTLHLLYKGQLKELKSVQKKTGSFVESLTGSTIIVNSTGTFLLKNNQLHRIYINNGIPELQLLMDNLNIQDISDVLWDVTNQTLLVSSSTDGLYVFKKQFFRSIVSPLSHTYINNFYAQVELPDGSIFSANAVVDSTGLILPQNKITNNSRSALITDQAGNLYFSDRSALFKTDKDFSVQKKIMDLNGDACSFIRQRDTIWLADRKKAGYILKDQFIEFYPGISTARADLPEITVLFTYYTTSWIGTANGLYILTHSNAKPQLITELLNTRISYITSCSDSSVFIGTKGQGCFLYKNGKFITLPMDKNNALSTVNAAIPDKNGFLWVTTNRGLLKASIEEIEKFADGKTEVLYYYYYYKEDGFSTNEFNNAPTSPVIIKKNGLFSFSSLKGLVWFNPYLIAGGNFPVNVFIDELSYDDSIIRAGAEIELPSSYSNFNVKLSAPYWGNRNNLELSYTLSAKDEKWSPVDESGFIHFTKLPKGSYTLLIKVRTGFGDHDIRMIKIPFMVLPAWYETTIFRIALIVLFLLVVYGIFRRRLNAIENEKIRLDALVKERTGELNSTIGKLSDTVLELTTSQDELNKVMEQKEKLTSILAHDLRTPLKFMTMLSEYLNKNFSSLPQEKMQALTSELMTSSKGTFTFADELLTWLSLQKQNFRVSMYEEDIKKIITELCAYVADMAHAKNIQLIIQSDDDLLAMTDERLLKVILRNLLDNAIKNTTDGTITIIVAMVDRGELQIQIQDTGKGMTAEQLKEINRGNAYGFSFEIKEKLGFQIIKDFTYKLNGNLVVKSELGKGTVVTLRFPQK